MNSELSAFEPLDQLYFNKRVGELLSDMLNREREIHGTIAQLAELCAIQATTIADLEVRVHRLERGV